MGFKQAIDQQVYISHYKYNTTIKDDNLMVYGKSEGGERGILGEL